MEERQWERYAALVGGIAFVVLIVVTIILSGSPPKLTDSPAKFAKYFKDHSDSIKVASYLGGLAFVPILVWLGSLWRALRRAEGGDPRLTVVATGGLLVGGAAVLVAQTMTGATAVSINDLGGAAKFFATFSQFLFASAGFAFAVLVGAVAVIAIRTGAFPKWFGLASGLLALGWLVAAIGSVSRSDVWMVVGIVVVILWLAWILALSAFMYRGTDRATT
jgi:hypothetical protein